MIEPTYDKDGYPDEDTIRKIQNWNFTEPKEVIEFISEAWNKGYGSVEESYPGVWVFSTGGWSGNEDLIEALKRNNILYSVLSWRSLHLPGGLWIFAVNDEGDRKLEELKEIILKWAWKK